jgi:hypothetical protein
MNGHHPTDPNEPSGFLSGSPEKLWPDRILFHGARIGLLVVLSLLLAGLFPPARQANVTRYEIGDVAQDEVLAQVAFSVPKTPEELAAERDEAAASTEPVFDFIPGAVGITELRLNSFFDRISDAGRRDGVAAVQTVLNAESIRVSDRGAEVLADSTSLAELRRAALYAVRQYLPTGVIESSQALDIRTDRIVIQEQDGGQRRELTSRILTNLDLHEAAIVELEGGDPELAGLLRLVLIRFLDHTLQPNTVLTGRRTSDARAAVRLTKGSEFGVTAELLRPNQPIDAEVIERLDAYYSALQDSGLLTPTARSRLPVLGASIVNFLLFMAYGVLLFFFRKEIYRNFRWLLVQAIVIAAYIAAAFVIERQGFASELLPVAFVILTVSVLWDGRMALVLALVLAILTGLQPPFAAEGAGLIGAIAVGGSAAGWASRNRPRSERSCSPSDSPPRTLLRAASSRWGSSRSSSTSPASPRIRRSSSGRIRTVLS